MVLINKAINEVTVKLVYYGPGLCGKTTNLEKIYANPKLDNKGKMISMSTETDRTLFFDFMPMELGTIAGQKVRVQLYTVPGQVFYDATRKLVLRGADGVVFVADSQASMRESNLDSLENLKTNLRINRIDPDKVAIVYQLNKRDLPGVSSVEEMSEYLGAGSSPVIEATAINGGGVTATLRAAVAAILDNLKNNVDTVLHDAAPLAPPDMSQRAGVTSSSAGTPKLSMRSEAPHPAAPAAPPVTAQAPFAAALAAEPVVASAATTYDNPFDTGDVAVDEVEDDPFAHVAVAVAEPERLVEVEDPFAEGDAEIHDAGAEHGELEELLANARGVVASLETALERARENERVIAARLRKS
jgi:mutual gliding-motility protein MglA